VARSGGALLCLVLGGGLPAALPPAARAAASPVPAAPAAPATITGRVVDPAGRAVGEAVVAAIPSGGSRAAAVVRTGRDGGFSVAVEAGWYALTATASGFGAAFEPPVAVEAGAARAVNLRLGEGGIDLAGRIEMAEDGWRPPAGMLVAASRFSAEDGDVFYGAADGAGAFALRLPEAGYQILLDRPGLLAVPVEVRLSAAAGGQRVTLAASRQEPAPSVVVDWLRGHEISLRTTSAGSGFQDLMPLAGVVGDARLVGLGEATHGAREFFQLKHRLFEFLASQLGFTVFAIEAGWPESLAVDDYVLHGTGDPAALLAGLGFWTWNTEEVLDLIRWMRAYNAGPDHPRKLRFQGFDMQQGGSAAAAVASYLERVDPACAVALRDALTAFREDRQWSSPAAAANAMAAARELLTRLDLRRDAYVRASSAAAWEAVRQHATVLAQSAELAAVERPDFRDRAMADNIEWIMAHQAAGARMVVWAHNNHVNYATGTVFEPMGEQLRRRLGASYLAVGLAFDQGEFQAMGRSGGGTGARQLAAFSLGPSPAVSLAAAFNRAGPAPALVDLRRRPAAGPVAAWLLAPHPMREAGAYFVTEADMTRPVVVAQRFDALLYLDHTTRARPNPAPAGLHKAVADEP
jgi:erythromycin esterase